MLTIIVANVLLIFEKVKNNHFLQGCSDKSVHLVLNWSKNIITITSISNVKEHSLNTVPFTVKII